MTGPTVTLVEGGATNSRPTPESRNRHGVDTVRYRYRTDTDAYAKFAAAGASNEGVRGELHRQVDGDAMQYVGYTASADPAAAVAVFEDLLKPGHFHREQELIQIFHGALVTPPGSLNAVVDRFADYALDDPHPLVRARALLAWGCHGSPEDFSVADEFWRQTARAAWRIYPFAAIQDRVQAGRDERYQLWSAEGEFLERVGQSLIGDRLSWRRI
jgi:hypothetical protein